MLRSILPAALASLLIACQAAAWPPVWPPVWKAPPDPRGLDATRFEAPTAEDCHRPPALREAPGGDGQARAGRSDASATILRRSVPLPSMAMPLAAPAAPADRDDIALEKQLPTVTAGMVDDNADFGGYLAYRQRHPGLNVRERDIGERYLLEVTDAAGHAVADAEVAVQAPGRPEPLMRARTDTAGRVWLHPRAFLPAGFVGDGRLGIAARKIDGKGGERQGRAVLRRGQTHGVALRLEGTPAATPARLDLVFLVDATGSMGDEIAKLKASMRAMSQQISTQPARPDICWGLVVYRDRGNAFLTRTADFTDRLGAFQEQLARVEADGGGDMPEALNEALHETVQGLAWRRDAVRLVVLVGDAPPHLDYGGPQYDVDMQAALGKGIKLFAVGASGLDPTGEYVFRQLAQYTGGRFVFLTYRHARDPSSGPGEETVHDVDTYSVQTLDRLVVRLVGEELGRLGAVR